MDVDRIGAAAGLIWQRLRQGGALTLLEIKKTRGDCTSDEIVAGLGWLAREGKVSIEPRSRRYYVSLVEADAIV